MHTFHCAVSRYTQPHVGPAAMFVVVVAGHPHGGLSKLTVDVTASSEPQVPMKTVVAEAAQYLREGSELRWMASEYVTPLAIANAVEPTTKIGNEDGIERATTTTSSLEIAPKKVSRAGGSRSRRLIPSEAVSRNSARIAANATRPDSKYSGSPNVNGSMPMQSETYSIIVLQIDCKSVPRPTTGPYRERLGRPLGAVACGSLWSKSPPRSKPQPK
eukprot:SAG31_NODE_2778_length_5104_cov_2.424775_2_plen_216_part_00